MKTFILFLILGLYKGMLIRSVRHRPSHYVLQPWCGILPDCYLYAASLDDLNIYSLKREEKGLPDFSEIKRGECSYDKPRCPIDII